MSRVGVFGTLMAEMSATGSLNVPGEWSPPMTNHIAPTPARPVGFSCRATRQCSPQQGAGEHGYRCAICHGATHQPVIRLARPAIDEASPAA